nr:MAG TPA: hypothetical protein [Caudoviricetes sp.]
MSKFIIKLIVLIILFKIGVMYMDIRDYNNIVSIYPICATYETPKQWHYNRIQKAKACYGHITRRQSMINILY